MENETSSEPKIFVDEDWKSRVEAEKQAAAGKSAPAPEAGKPTAAAATELPAATEPPAAKRPAEQRQSGDRPLQLPPATFSFLVTTLATQAMVSLGQAPNPFTGKAEVHLPEAKHFIDTLGMLSEKTRGNLAPEEAALLDGFLHQLRLAYIEAHSQPAPDSAAGEEAGTDPESSGVQADGG